MAATAERLGISATPLDFDALGAPAAAEGGVRQQDGTVPAWPRVTYHAAGMTRYTAA
jgi:hypothetical protein